MSNKRKIVWALPAMVHFGRIYSEALGWPLEVGSTIGECDTVFVCGLYDLPDYELTLASIQGAEHKHFHFGGSDVPHLQYPEILPAGSTFSCDTPVLADELFAKGIEVEFILYGPTKFHAEVKPLPKIPHVAVYFGTNPIKYGSEIVRVLQDAMPDVKFVGYSYGAVPDEEMEQLIQECTATLRLVAHDGGSATVREFLEAGRYALATQPFDYAVQIRRDDVNDIIAKLRAIFKNKEPNWEAANFYHEANSEETFRRELLAHL
jgi:hypothetical protein